MSATGTGVEKRCIVLVGKSGAGKSTVANAIYGYDPLSKDAPPFKVSTKVLQSVTLEVTHKHVKVTRDGIEYYITVIDTVGLFDTKVGSNDVILAKIEGYFKDYINEINLILFVFKKGRFTAEEEDVFSLIREKFKDEVSPISALAVTTCENDSAEVRKEFIQELRSNPKTGKIARQMEKGIFPVGFPPLKSMPPAVQPAYKESFDRDRETLMDLAIQSDQNKLTRTLFEEKVKPKIEEEMKKEDEGWCTIL